MKKEWILIPVACFSLLVAGLAEAQGSNRMRSPGKSPRIDLGSRMNTGVNLGRAPRASSAVRSTPSVRRPSVSGNSGLNRDRVPNTGHNPFSGRDFGENPLGSLLGQYLNNGHGYGRGFDPYAGEKAHAEAYRDAAIANAIVNVVGILVTANQPRFEAAYPTAGVAVAPAGPRGYVERQRVLVQEGRTEEYQVWIPEHRIPETGEVVVGHHETRRREIAPVYEEREVWVPAP